MKALLRVWLARRDAGPLLATAHRRVAFSEALGWLDASPASEFAAPCDSGRGRGQLVGLRCGSADVDADGLFMLWARGLVPVLLPEADVEAATRQALADHLVLGAMLRRGEDDRWSLEAFPASPAKQKCPELALAHMEASALVLLTSGTTGLPKAVGFSAAALASVGRLSWGALESHGAGDAGPGTVRWLSPLPWHHAGGLAPLLRTLPIGGTWLPWASRPFIPDDLCRYGAAEGATHLSLVPTQLRRVLEAQQRPWSALRCVLLSGDDVPMRLLTDARERGWPVLPAYGQTESLGWIAAAQHAGLDSEEVVTFFPHEGVSVTQDPADRALRYTSPTQASWSLDPATGRFETLGSEIETRDRVEFIGEGFRVMGRLDDMILCGGENLDPSMIEAAVCRATGAVAAVAFGVADGDWGQVPACVFALPEGEGSLDARASGSHAIALNALRALPALLRPRLVCAVEASELMFEHKRSRRQVASACAGKLRPLTPPTGH